VIPISTSIHKTVHPTPLFLAAGETGLPQDYIARADDITVVRKANLIAPRSGLLTASYRRICELSELVNIAMGCF
jgi:mRNA-degrading endonuclease toxin of MazEF toxin-antitoxin module